jgi:penicillin-binding protein 2
LAHQGRRFAVALTFFTALFVILEARFFYLQILHGEDYRKRARISAITEERIPPHRGKIRDRKGKILATNVASFRATLTPHYVARDPRRQPMLDALQALLPMSDEKRQDLDERIDAALANRKAWDPIIIAKDLASDTSPDHGGPLDRLENPLATLYCPSNDVTYLPIDPKASNCPTDRADGVRVAEPLTWDDDTRRFGTCKRSERRFTTGTTCPDGQRPLIQVVRDLRDPATGQTYSNQVAALRARLHDLPGVEIHTDFMRHYPNHYEAAHLLGYMSRVTVEDRKRWSGVYGLRDMIGRTGVEKSKEPTLRGTSGHALHVRDAKGHRSEAQALEALAGGDSYQRAVAGQDVWLTLDIDLQVEVRKAFRYYKSGAAVVIDPRTGEVLALYSKPGFDSNHWSGRLTEKQWKETTSNPYTPLINKASTPYAPGSVYKIVTAAAALTDGIATPDTTIDCPGHYDFGGRRFHCHNRSGHGPVNLKDALKVSCDVYFYRIGEMLGMDRLAAWGRRFGFGQPTGVEISERTGRVPTRQWHADHTVLGWQPGFTLSTAIGQGSLTSSPLQVARAFAALINGGDLIRLRLIDRLVDEAGRTTRSERREVSGVLGVSEESTALIRQGLDAVINDPDGTGFDLALETFSMSGKTGTAEAAQVRPGASEGLARWLKEDHAWFVAYGPTHDPQVVTAVFVEHGGSGSKHAGPIAKRIIQAWDKLGYRERTREHEDPPAPDPDDPYGLGETP